jgi:hypothetical protein
MGDEILYRKQETSPKDINHERSEFYDRQAMAGWEQSFKEGSLQRLRYLDAVLCRVTDPDEVERLKGRVGELIRETDPAAILGDPHLVTMVRWLFSEKGLVRLRERAKQTHKGLVADMADSLHQRGTG